MNCFSERNNYCFSVHAWEMTDSLLERGFTSVIHEKSIVFIIEKWTLFVSVYCGVLFWRAQEVIFVCYKERSPLRLPICFCVQNAPWAPSLFLCLCNSFSPSPLFDSGYIPVTGHTADANLHRKPLSCPPYLPTCGCATSRGKPRWSPPPLTSHPAH